MPYEFYKVLHLVMIVVFIACMALSFFASHLKLPKILMGISSLLIFVAGMGLMARIGVSHTGGYPQWIYGKFAGWAVLAIVAPILAKRAKNAAGLAFTLMMAVAAVMVVFAVYKF